MEQKTGKSIVVLSCHRSGSSMIAGILHTLGVNMGSDFVQRHWSNPLGHFEDKDFVLLNRNILEAAGGNWKNPPTRQAVCSTHEQFQRKISELVDRKRATLWGWKDPRTALTIDLFLPHLTNPYFVICSRRPESMADSLVRRDGISTTEAESIVTVYRQRINEFASENKHLPILTVSYEDALESPEKVLHELVKFLNISVDQSTQQKAISLVLPKEKIRKVSSRQKRNDQLMHFARCCYHLICRSFKKN